MSDSSSTGAGPGQYADDARRYRLDSRIATGGMGEVWRATDTTLGRTVAVKVLKHEYADDAAFRTRFETEARHAAALGHPGIASVFDFGEARSADGSPHPRPYLVMELVEGEPLSALLQQGRPMDPQVVSDLMAQAASALAAAHAAGIVHRDVKPANLMITPDGTVKITDFGIARAADSVGITQTGQVLGTPQYLSPEQARGDQATAASDVYALGVVAFECLAGRRPFQGESPVATALAHLQQPVPSLPDSVPGPLASVVRKALAKEPSERYAGASAFAAALRDPSSAAPDAAATAVVPPAVVPPPGDATSVMPAAAAPDPTPTPAPTPATTGLPAAQQRSSVWPAVLVTVLVIAVAAVVVALILTSGDGDEDPVAEPTSSAPTSESSEPTEEPTTEEPTPTEPATVEVDEDDYIGRQVAEVEDDLEQMNLTVARDELDNDGTQTEGEVADVNPTGTLQEGQQVTVAYWGPPPPEETPTEEPTEGDDEGGVGSILPGSDESTSERDAEGVEG